MKNILLTIALIITSNILFSQSQNWNTIEKNNASQIYLNLGYDFGMTTQLGYAYKLNTAKSVMLLSDFSVPMGNMLNDYKYRLGAQLNLLNFNSIKSSAQYMVIARRNETNLVRKIGLGQVLSLTTGIYKEKWHVAFEFGYDSSLATHLKHSEEMQSYYSDIKNAWFKNTGGHWHYGIQGSKAIGERMELNMSVGATNARGADVNALLPAYFDLGLVYFVYGKGRK